jgi:hypothetical protein
MLSPKDEDPELRRLKSLLGLRMKVSAKGAISLYGLRRFPITLYEREWRIVIANIKEIEAFIDKHLEEISRSYARGEIINKSRADDDE